MAPNKRKHSHLDIIHPADSSLYWLKLYTRAQSEVMSVLVYYTKLAPLNT